MIRWRTLLARLVLPVLFLSIAATTGTSQVWLVVGSGLVGALIGLLAIWRYLVSGLTYPRRLPPWHLTAYVLGGGLIASIIGGSELIVQATATAFCGGFCLVLAITLSLREPPVTA